MLQINKLVKTFRGSRSPTGPGKNEVRALRSVSLEVEPGELVVVRGSSGCGKSTLLLAAGGLLEPDSGNVLVNGQDVYSLTRDARARFRAENIGFVFQQFHLIPYLDVLDNVLAPSLALAGADKRAGLRRPRPRRP